jgi:peptidyl-prolyl cis-trans isomerase A (cyclophilin A)
MAPNKKRTTSKRKSNKTLYLAIGIIAIVLIGIGSYIMLGQSANPPTNATPTPSPTPSTSTAPSATPTDPAYINPTKVQLQTSAGNITLELRTDKPITSGNFENLVRQGLYDGTLFHRTMAGFMIQGGMITSQSIPTINDEIGQNNRNVPYTIAMAKTSNPNSATSQFFINVADNGNNPNNPTFDSTYAVFGRVIEGKDVVDAIANAPVSNNQYTGEPSVPVHPFSIIKATILP